MNTRFVLLMGVVALLGGCSASVSSSSDPAASPDTSWDQRNCELRGGYWNRNASVCEAPLYRW